MELLRETEYFVYNETVTRPIRICILSDLHYSDLINEEKLDWILMRVEELEPDYIFFVGDMVDSVDNIDEALFLWWKKIDGIGKRINQITNGLISIGSHDYWTTEIDEETGKFKGIEAYPEEFFGRLNDLEHITVLNNSDYQDDNIYVTGYTQHLNYYYSKPIKKKRLLTPIPENKEVMINDLTRLIHEYDSALEMAKKLKKVRFLLANALTFAHDEDVYKIFSPHYEFAVGGHTHNGLVPPGIHEMLPFTFGFINPDRKLFQRYSRNTLRKKGDKIIVNGPLTTFQKCSGSKTKLNVFYPSCLTVLNIVNDKVYDTEKIFTKSRYVK